VIAELGFELTLGDRAWEAGALASAHAAYLRAFRLRRDVWHAAFFVSWIDLAFGPIERGRFAQLMRMAPDRTWHDLLAARVAELEEGDVLEGDLAAWDIHALRAAARGHDAFWWHGRAVRAHAARQYGLARACFDEATTYTPVREHEPPGPYRRAVAESRRLLTAVRATCR
jgi:hypothetical protein